MVKFNIQDPDSVVDVSDWVELFIAVNKCGVSKAELSSFLEESSGSEPAQSFLDDVWLEMTKRMILYGNTPPFSVGAREIASQIDWQTNPGYLTCLILDIEGNSNQPTVAGKLFERISAEAIRNYLGGSAIIYGFPSRQNMGDIAQELNEKFGFDPNTNFKDRGVDIIAWKPFDDTRKSQVVVLLQCAAGYNWKSKLLQIPYDAWCQYISWSNKPIKGFTTPEIIRDSEFHDAAVDAGLLLDRARIYRHTTSSIISDHNLQGELQSWCNNQIQLLQI